VDAPPSSAEASHRTKGLLRLTMACNERCPFCNVPAEDYPRLTPPPDEIAAELDAFVATGQRTLTISGGEPTLLKKRLLALISEARARGVPFVELQTNAVLIDGAYARALAEAGLTSAFISLLSDHADQHDQLAGLPGAFPRCLAGIDALLDVGVRVTLNPVVARISQHRVADYISFVAERLPRVRSISLSAVQPHGRAGRGDQTQELLPDYEVLASILPEARRRANGAAIELLNPYCGLPLCIGWSEDPARSVEAIEAAEGGWRPLPGIENEGDKDHGPACQRCTWRTRCGGAWRAYWALRGGRGLVAPSSLVLPWEGAPGPDQLHIDARGGLSAEALSACRAATCPSVLVWVRGLGSGDADRLLGSGCTDLAVDLDPSGLLRAAHPRRRAVGQTLLQLRQLQAAAAASAPARRLRLWLRLMPGAPEAEVQAAASWAAAQGIPLCDPPAPVLSPNVTGPGSS
jgi:MoaA/NifB/PqqE/SkfB family radical SAM enzyme